MEKIISEIALNKDLMCGKENWLYTLLSSDVMVMSPYFTKILSAHEQQLDPIGSKVLWKWVFKKILNRWKRVSIGLKINEKIYTKCFKSVK